MKKRIITAVTGSEEMKILPTSTVNYLLQKNIRASDLLLKLYLFNADPTEALKLYRGLLDEQIFQVTCTLL